MGHWPFSSFLYWVWTSCSLQAWQSSRTERDSSALFRIGPRFGFVGPAFLVPAFVALGPVEPGQAVLAHDILKDRPIFFRAIFLGIFLQADGLFVAPVHFQDLQDLVLAQGMPIRRIVLIGKPKGLLEYVRFLAKGQPFLGHQFAVLWGKVLKGLQVHVQFVVQAAFELPALSGQFLWVQGQLLVPGRRGAHAPEIGEPSGTTEFPATGADAPQPLGLLPVTDLSHLDADLEDPGHILD